MVEYSNLPEEYPPFLENLFPLSREIALDFEEI